MKNFTRRLAISTVAAGTLFATAFTPGAFAADDTTATVTGGSLGITNAVADDFALRDVTGAAQTTTAALGTFKVTDARGSGAGWNVTAQASRFTVAGTGGKQLALGSLAMSKPTVSSSVSDSPDPTFPAVDGVFIDNAAAVKIVSAAQDQGMGAYDISATTLTLSLPADVYAGAYVSTITLTQATAP